MSPRPSKALLVAIVMAEVLIPNMASAAAARRRPSPPQCPATGSETVTLAKVTGATSFLAANGKEYRLAGVLARGDDGATLVSGEVERNEATLARVLAEGPLTLAPSAGAPDRYGRVGAQVFAGGNWVQGALLKAGQSRANPDAASAICAALLLAAEAEARAARAGHWAGQFFPRQPEQLRNRGGLFEIVEGTVTTASLVRGRAFINFGTDYRSDFTVSIAPADMRAFRQAKFDVKSLAGKRVRVRGWIEFYNGPEIQLSLPAAIELLD